MALLIIVFVILSYWYGARSILSDSYRPSLYSRVIWLLLALNNLVSVVLLQSGRAVEVLAGLGLFGNLLILILTLRKSRRVFGRAEAISSLLLLASLIIWFTTSLPVLNLSIGLIAHFI